MTAKILIVDDSSTDRLIIKKMLSDYDTLTACDGVEALEILDVNSDIDLVILDLNMPNMNGFQVLGILNSNEKYKDLKTIILTDFDQIDSEIKGLKMGAIDYIRKPIHMESLKVRIDIHIELIKVQQLYKQKLYERNSTFDIIFQQAPIGMAISHKSESLDGKNNSTIINPAFEKISGRTKEELVRIGWQEITHPDDIEEDKEYFEKLNKGEINSYTIEKRLIKPDGSIVWVYLVVAKIDLINEYEYNHITLIQDITKRKEFENALLESERSKSVLLGNLPGMAYRCKYDRDWTMEFVSEGCFLLTGYPPESLIYNNKLSYNDIITPIYREPLWNEWKRIIEHKLPFRYEYEISTANGQIKWVLELGQVIYDGQDNVEALEGIILDITDRKEMENNLRYNNDHDLWTGLHNRRYLENLLSRDANINTREKRALISINMSPVHMLSLTYGFNYSQQLIKKAAQELSLIANNKHQLFNTHENRFVFYIKDYKDKNELEEFCKIIIKKLEPVFTNDRINNYIGIVEIDEENKIDIEQLLKKLLIATEKALYNFESELEFCFFDKAMEEQIIREEDIKQELRLVETDSSNGGLYLLYQPVLDLKSNQISGFEALARLKSDKLGLISPLEFIPIAEKTRQIISFGEKIIYKALCYLRKLEKNGYDKIQISINVSTIQLLEEDFSKNMIKAIRDVGVNPKNIGIEITESMLADNYQEINKILAGLKEYGIQIAIDDFGTGYSSLARERELNVSCLKIDKYFIDKLIYLRDDEAITGDIISMAHKLGHYVIAEGVEYEKQREYLVKYGCDKIQGYLFSKPLDEEAAIELLKMNIAK